MSRCLLSSRGTTLMEACLAVGIVGGVAMLAVPSLDRARESFRTDRRGPRSAFRATPRAHSGDHAQRGLPPPRDHSRHVSDRMPNAGVDHDSVSSTPNRLHDYEQQSSGVSSPGKRRSHGDDLSLERIGRTQAPHREPQWSNSYGMTRGAGNVSPTSDASKDVISSPSASIDRPPLFAVGWDSSTGLWRSWERA